MSLVYHSIATAVQLGRSTEEIVNEITSQCVDDPIQMVVILTTDLIQLVRKLQERTDIDLTDIPFIDDPDLSM